MEAWMIFLWLLMLSCNLRFAASQQSIELLNRSVHMAPQRLVQGTAWSFSSSVSKSDGTLSKPVAQPAQLCNMLP